MKSVFQANVISIWDIFKPIHYKIYFYIRSVQNKNYLFNDVFVALEKVKTEMIKLNSSFWKVKLGSYMIMSGE